MITGEIKEVSPVNGNIIDLPPISASIGNVSITVQTGGAVNSVNGQKGDVVLTAEDVGALPADAETYFIVPFYNSPTNSQKKEISETVKKARANAGKCAVFMNIGSEILPAQYEYVRNDIITAILHDNITTSVYEIVVTPSGAVTTKRDGFFATDINEGGTAQAPTVQAVTKYVEEQLAEGSQNGATFTPSVSANGVISWTNDRELSNPEPVNIMGPAGYTPVKGTDYFTEADKAELVAATVAALPKYNGEVESV